MIGAVEMQAVSADEQLARYILHSSHIRQDKTLRADPFIPHPYPDLSVTRQQNLSEAEIWSAGNHVALQTGKPLKGRAETLASTYLGKNLRILEDPLPENPHHANVTNWPADKPTQKILALEIAAQSVFISR
jgi:hypothetical protein